MRPPKFKIGDKVRCRKPSLDVDITGAVTRVANAGSELEPDYEYWVTNSPCVVTASLPLLWWESEMELAP